MIDLSLRHLHARPRLVGSVGVGLAVYVGLPMLTELRTPTRALLAWNLGAGLYLALVLQMVWRADHERIAQRALTQDEGRHAVLFLSAAAALASLAAIVAQMAVAKDHAGLARAAHVGLAVLTLTTAWTFIHTIFALHYAHDYYVRRQRGQGGGIDFPGTPHPLYSDFFYLAMVIGTSGQTADVSFTVTGMRRTALWHCVLAFAFNTTLLALTINVAAGLF